MEDKNLILENDEENEENNDNPTFKKKRNSEPHVFVPEEPITPIRKGSTLRKVLIDDKKEDEKELKITIDK